LNQQHGPQGQQLYPVLGRDGNLRGVVSRADLENATESEVATLDGIAHDPDGVAYPDESLRAIVYRMAGSGKTRFLVTDRAKKNLLGLISLEDLLRARTRNFHEERTRERVLHLRVR
jgi:CIC family chloride channel protein